MPMWDGSMTLTVFAFTNQIFPSDDFVTAGLEPLASQPAEFRPHVSNVVTWTFASGRRSRRPSRFARYAGARTACIASRKTGRLR